MHLGHQKLVEKVIEVANKKNLKKALLTFDQHPKSYLANVSFKELMSLDDKAMFLEEYGFDYLFVLKFDFELASMRALDFINEFIVKTNIKHIICGFDFHFGKNGEGNFETLIQNEKNNYEVSVIKKQEYNHHKISSSYLKEALTNGNVELVEKLLGRYYCVSGKVVHGLKNGRKIGFPTVNIDANNYFLPKNGVYGVIIVIDGKRYLGMANLGYNPTFNVLTKVSLEVNIFDFDQDVYGAEIHDCGGAAPDSCLCSCCKVICGHCSRHMQVKMGMGIDKSGKQKAACYIRHLCVLFRQARDFFRTAYGRHLFPVNEHICLKTAASGHHCPAS